MRQLKFFQSINEALFQSMIKNSKVLIMGLGVDDPKGIFGTTLNLNKKFGQGHTTLQALRALFQLDPHLV